MLGLADEMLAGVIWNRKLIDGTGLNSLQQMLTHLLRLKPTQAAHHVRAYPVRNLH